MFNRVPPDYYCTVKLVMISGDADPIMPHVGRLGQLEEVDFFPRRKGNDIAFGLTDAGMVHLRNLTQLRHLSLGVNTAQGSVGSKITGKSLAAIAGAKRLQILQLQGIPLVDADLAILEGLSDLRILTIESPDVTDAGLAHLAGLAELRDLGLQGTRVTAEGIKHLRGLTRLHKLNLALTRVESLETCRSLGSLESLVLARAPIGDAGLAPAPGSSPGFAGLNLMNLAFTRVSDAGLMHLRDLPKLRLVQVINSAVTDAGVAEFKKARSGVNVMLKLPPSTPRPPRAPAKKQAPAAG